jgi:hypothetical protein
MLLLDSIRVHRGHSVTSLSAVIRQTPPQVTDDQIQTVRGSAAAKLRMFVV